MFKHTFSAGGCAPPTTSLSSASLRRYSSTLLQTCLERHTGGQHTLQLLYINVIQYV